MVLDATGIDSVGTMGLGIATDRVSAIETLRRATATPPQEVDRLGAADADPSSTLVATARFDCGGR